MPTKPTLLLLLSCALSNVAWAQASQPAPNATAMTREMGNRLQLNEGQYIRLLTLNRTRLTRQLEIEQATKGNLAVRTAQLAELQAQYESECGRIMSPSQLAQLMLDTGQPGGGNG